MRFWSVAFVIIRSDQILVELGAHGLLVLDRVSRRGVFGRSLLTKPHMIGSGAGALQPSLPAGTST